MDCLSLLEYSGGVKSLHIANATQYFTFSQIYGLHFWKEVALLHYTDDYKTTVNLLTAVYHSHSTQQQLFADKGDLHLCEYPAEFLLEPWLLMQVPWHPPVYNQWLAAALGEVLKAKKELVEFYWWPIPRRLLTVVGLLLSQVETLHRRLISGIRLINWMCNSNGESGHGFETNCDMSFFILSHVILPSLPAIEFLVGTRFKIVARSIKRMAWPSEGGLNTEEDITAKDIQFDTEKLHIYSYNFYEDGAALHMFGKTESLQEVKDELAKLPYTIGFVLLEYDDEVSNFIV